MLHIEIVNICGTSLLFQVHSDKTCTATGRSWGCGKAAVHNLLWFIMVSAHICTWNVCRSRISATYLVFSLYLTTFMFPKLLSAFLQASCQWVTTLEHLVFKLFGMVIKGELLESPIARKEKACKKRKRYSGGCLVGMHSHSFSIPVFMMRQCHL